MQMVLNRQHLVAIYFVALLLYLFISGASRWWCSSSCDC